MNTKKASYHPLTSAEPEDPESFTDFSNSVDVAILSPHQRWKKLVPSLTLGALGLLIILLSGLIVAVLTHKTSDQQCARQLSVWSPALEAVDYIEIDFANAFNSRSIYRGPPIKETEEAWFSLTYKHGVEVPSERLRGLNRSEEDGLMHVPPEVGDSYVGLLEVFHQLHCLNIVRMYTWWQAGKYSEPPLGLTSDPLKNRMHVDHCLETLRIALMCSGDVTPLLLRLGGPAGARADFETHHKCRDFNKIEDWIDNNWTVK